jgi:hypothetical protein
MTLFLLQPVSGHVLVVHRCFGPVHLVAGYCRSAIQCGPRVKCLGCFRRAEDASLRASWAEATDLGFLLIAQITIAPVKEADWMLLTKPANNQSSKNQNQDRIQ